MSRCCDECRNKGSLMLQSSGRHCEQCMFHDTSKKESRFTPKGENTIDEILRYYNDYKERYE